MAHKAVCTGLGTASQIHGGSSAIGVATGRKTGRRALVIGVIALQAIPLCIAAAGAPVDDPTYAGEGTRYRVIQLVPIPKIPGDEIRTKRRSKDQIWIPGYWERTADDWRWVAGRWAIPPNPSAEWQPGHWRRSENAWDWTTGGWIVTDIYQARKEVEAPETRTPAKGP